LLIGHKFFHPPRVLGPLVGKIDNDSRFVGLLQQLKPCPQHVALIIGVIRTPRRVAQGKIKEYLTWVAGAGGYITGIGESYRGDPSLLQNPGNQTNGLMTYRSDRGQQGHIDIVLQASSQNFRPIHFGRLAMAVVGQGAIVGFAQAIEHPFS